MKKLTEHSSSWQADISSASQISRILWNPKFHRRVHNSHHLFLSSTRFFQSLLSNPNALVSIEICSSHLHLGLPSGIFPSRFPPYASLFYPPHAPHAPPLSSFLIWFHHRNRIWNAVYSTQLCPYSSSAFFFQINPLAPELLFLISAHPVYKMWIIREPNKLALWNTLHFEEKKTESVEHV